MRLSHLTGHLLAEGSRVLDEFSRCGESPDASTTCDAVGLEVFAGRLSCIRANAHILSSELRRCLLERIIDGTLFRRGQEIGYAGYLLAYFVSHHVLAHVLDWSKFQSHISRTIFVWK